MVVGHLGNPEGPIPGPRRARRWQEVLDLMRKVQEGEDCWQLASFWAFRGVKGAL